MTPLLPLDQMSLADKVQAMELLWADLSKARPPFPSPAWHRDVLAERRKLVEENAVRFLDWDAAIADLRREVSAPPAS